jgi:MoaD family protein
VRVTVRLFSHLRLALGQRMLDMELPAGATAADVMERLRTLTGPELESMIVGGPEGGYRLVVLVNDRRAQAERPLHEGDVLSLLPPLGGG